MSGCPQLSYKSVGIGLENVALANLVWQRAQKIKVYPDFLTPFFLLHKSAISTKRLDFKKYCRRAIAGIILINDVEFSEKETCYGGWP
jgi:hypothetical protein